MQRLIKARLSTAIISCCSRCRPRCRAGRKQDFISFLLRIHTLSEPSIVLTFRSGGCTCIRLVGGIGSRGISGHGYCACDRRSDGRSARVQTPAKPAVAVAGRRGHGGGTDDCTDRRRSRGFVSAAPPSRCLTRRRSGWQCRGRWSGSGSRGVGAITVEIVPVIAIYAFGILDALGNLVVGAEDVLDDASNAVPADADAPVVVLNRVIDADVTRMTLRLHCVPP